MTPKVSDYLFRIVQIGPDIFVKTPEGLLPVTGADIQLASQITRDNNEAFHRLTVWHSMPHGPLEHGG